MDRAATKDSDFDPLRVASFKALSGDPPYFYRQPETVHFDFDQGLPDPDTYPTETLARLAAEVIHEPYVLEYMVRMEYTDLLVGDARFRKEIAQYIDRRDGGQHDPMGLMVTHGSAHGIGLVGNAFLDPGDAVFVEDSTFPFGVRYFEATGAKVIHIEIDEDGMKMDVLEQAIQDAIASGLRPKMVYTIATHHLPTGLVLSLERRHALLELASRFDMMIHEDNIYREYGPGRKVPTLLSLDHEGRVLQSDSFAKNVAPGIRIGWIAAHPSAIVALAKVRQDLGVSMWLQAIMRRYLEDGYHEQHIEEVTAIYAEKRRIASAALREFCAPEISFKEPVGGWYYWLELDPDIDWQAVKDGCYNRGIAMRPGELFLGDPKQPRMRLSIGQVSHDAIRNGIRELGQVVKSIGKTHR